jgi:hypothetical protein
VGGDPITSSGGTIWSRDSWLRTVHWIGPLRRPQLRGYLGARPRICGVQSSRPRPLRWRSQGSPARHATLRSELRAAGRLVTLESGRRWCGFCSTMSGEPASGALAVDDQLPP